MLSASPSPEEYRPETGTPAECRISFFWDKTNGKGTRQHNAPMLPLLVVVLIGQIRKRLVVTSSTGT
ncbi:unnamed protein product [Haemonchus placei]|uniref:Uncharacterized protein n=1 Tax=Haemonchus placei TaxID=6290 RepID=A0A0N4WH72_HAEPC|nr:unnamed protein product [Haemonchus placei]